MPVNHTIKLRRDTGANWEAKNPVLSAGEVALDSTKNAYKVGDGTKTWTQLSYLMPGNLTAIRSGTSSVIFDTVNGNVEIGVNGNATLVEFRKDNSFINNQLEVDGDYLTGTMTMTTDANGDPIPGTITTWGNMLITHDLFVLGAVTSSVDQPTFNVPENIANLGFNNITDIVDIGVIANANNGTANFNTGFYRDASDAGTFKFFNNLTEYPNGKPVASGSLTLADIQVGGVDATLLLTGSNASANNIFATGVFKGDASNITQATPSNGVAGGTSNIFINNNSNINLSMGGVANVGVVTKGGISTSLNVSVSGKSNLNSASNLTITGGNAGQFAKTDGNGNVTWSAFVTDRIANGTSNVLANTQHGVIHASVNGHVDAATFSGTGLGSDLPVTITGNITAANIVATGSITGTLDADSNAQPNVTSLGTLTSLTVDGDPSANGSYANVVLGSVNGNLNLGPAGNIKVTGGTLGYSIQTDGAGNVTFWENANFVGAPWATTNSYGVGQVIKYKGSLYIANDDIPANYGFKLGVSGKTWKPLGGLTYTHTSTLTNAINDGALNPAAIDISAAINVPQTTPNIYYTLMAPTSRAPRILTINNTGTEAFYINGDYRLAPNYSVVAVWTGTAWQFAAVNPGISNWYFNEAATGLSYSGKGGTFYAVDTTLTSIGNAVAPQNVEGFISGVLSGTGSFQAYGGGNIKLTNLNTYTGSTNVKYSTRMTYLDNGGLGTAVANTTQTYASTGTISTVGNTVTRTFSADSMMVFPVTSVPTTYAANLFVVAGGGGGGAGSLAVNDLAVNGKGGGGGAGGEVISASVIVTPGTVLEFTIGQGGTGGVTDSESGDQGGATTVTVIEGSMTYANATPITSLTARGGRGGGGGQSFTQQNRGGVGWNVVSGGSSTDTIYGANDRTAAGTGITSTISNTQFAVGGGSGGSANQTGTTVANGASGGNGSTNRSTDATSGASASPGTGSGGGGGAGQSHGRAGSPGGNGGSGQVQIQFQTKQGGSLATGGVSTSAGTTTIHTFSGDGLFTIPLTSTISNVRYLMVGGGGGGAGVEDSTTTGSGWGGGEGGEVKTGYITVTPGQTLNITVGAGGGYTKVGTALRGQKGGDTVISGQGFTTLTAVGGNGASAKPGGTGGPGADGGAGLTGNGGNGGTGTSNDITGLTVFYGGGGGGGRGTSGTTAGSGGNGGGGSGGGISQPGSNGLTGGGGGGAGASNGVAGAFPGGSGGKGLVVFSYTTPINAYDVTTNSSYSIEGVFEHDAYNNQIFTNTLQGNGSYEKKRYTVDTFTNFVNLAGNVKVQQGILRIGNGSSASMNMGSNIETSDNTETIYYSPATVAGRYNVYRPISGAGNVIFDSPSSTQGQYSMTSTLAGVTGNLIIRANAALTGSTAVNFPANITVDNGGALHANSSVSVWSGNATISGNGQAFYGVTGAIGIESGSTLSANIKMLDDSKIYIYANAGSNTASTTTISSAITGDKIMYLQTATMNPVSLTGSIDSTQPLTLVSGNYTFATTFNTNPSMGVDIRSGTNVILTEDVTWGNLNSETNTTITAPSATTVITLGYNHRSATMRSNIKLGSINKVGTGTQAIDVDLLPTTLANVTGNTTVTAGILDVGGNTNGGYLPFGNINVAANSVLRLSRTDLISKGNTAVNAFQQGIPLNQNLIGTGNIELYGNIQQSECTGYYPGLYYPAQENHTMPDNTGFTGNLLINAGSKWSVFSDVDRFSNVIVGSNGALHLKAYYNESVFRANGTFTVPTGTTYTAQYVVIGGGGGGGGGVYYSSGSINYRAGGGGGGGGIASGRNTALAPSTYTITVGAGGTSGPSRTDGSDWPTLGGVGGTSSAFGLTATGGQGGRASTYAANGSVGTPGASTGGQGQWSATNGTVNQSAGQGALSTVTTANTYWQSTRWATAGSGGLSGIWFVVQNSTTTSASPAGALGARGTTAPTVPTEWGGGGGGGGVTRNADNTGFITHNGGVGANGAVGILWYNNATEFVYTPNVSITGNGTQEGGVQYGAINCTDGNWNLTGNITVATTGGVTDTKIYANKQVRFTGQNITGSANLNIDGTAGGLVVLATTTNTMNGNIKCYYGQNLAFNTSISTGCSANIIVQAWSGQSSTLHIGQTESNIAFTTAGNLNVQTNGRVKFYSQGTNQLSRINVNTLTVGTSWTVDIIGNLTQNGTYTIIGSTQTLPSTVPSVGTVPTGKTVVFSYVNGTGLVATVS